MSMERHVQLFTQAIDHATDYAIESGQDIRLYRERAIGIHLMSISSIDGIWTPEEGEPMWERDPNFEMDVISREKEFDLAEIAHEESMSQGRAR